MESLKTEIQTLLHIFDIKINENRDKIYAYKTKYQSNNEETKQVDSKILNFLFQDEYEHKLNKSLIRQEVSIDINTKNDDILTEINSLATKTSENSSVNKTTLPRALSFSHSAEIIKVKRSK